MVDKVEFTLSDSQGRMIESGVLKKVDNLITVSGHTHPGFYFIRTGTNQVNTTERILIQ
ncbi:MAG: T9SS type A sorting domain-containing protein [Crocinitomicaceae bacterium]|nr:T9SS type A sorting domain-containing protein [Crocinitomicaceae bacterium]